MIEALQVLFDDLPADRVALPDDLAEIYGGPLGLDNPGIYANFVSTLDGAVALTDVPRSNRIISMGSRADRFVMGLLRARAELVLVGAGTFAASRRTWSPSDAHPDGAEPYARYRAALGLSSAPAVAVLTRSGDLPAEHPVFSERTVVVLTTRDGEHRLRSMLPDSVHLVVPDDGLADPVVAVKTLHELGYRHILSESGPHLFGSLVRSGLVDNLFLTTSPQLAGGSRTDALRLVEGPAMLPAMSPGLELASVRRAHSHLFLRYRFTS